jgi:hypothetical protein
MDDRERDLADAATELSETLEELRAELQEPSRGPFGLPRPPSPTELLRFTEQYTIPTVIALLEASIRVLELLAAGLRVADGRPLDAVSDRSVGAIERAGRDRLAQTSQETLRRLDDALTQLQSAAAGEPSDPELRRLLDEARKLRSEVDERLSAAVSEPDTDTKDNGGSSGVEIQPSEDGVGVDVDDELASIKEELHDERSERSAVDPGDEETDDKRT